MPGRLRHMKVPSAFNVATLPMWLGFQATMNPTSRAPSGVNLCTYAPILLNEEVTITRLLWRTGTNGGNGNYDIGIYDSDAEGKPGSRLVSTGSVAFPAGSTDVINDIADQTIGPGQFWLAFTMSDVDDDVMGITNSPDIYRYAIFNFFGQASALPLPATATPTRGVFDDVGFWLNCSLVRN